MIDIRSKFVPYQPAVSEEGLVTYHEFAPDNTLRPYIYCYWELRSTTILSEDFIYRVVSDGCIDVFFDPSQSDDAFVMGFCKHFMQFSLGTQFHYLGIRFLPSYFSAFFNVDVSTLSNQYQSLNEVYQPLARFISNNILAKTSQSEIVEMLDGFLINHLRENDLDFDSRFYTVLQVILDRSGNINLQNDIPAGLSPRQLRRLFQRHIGTTMKRFSKVVRFQKVLGAKPSQQGLSSRNFSFYDGYYDQAHFIKEFKAFYGVTPSEAFGR